MKITVKHKLEVYEADGKDLAEALYKLKMPRLVSPAIMTVGKREKIIKPVYFNRLFSASSLIREVALKHFTSLFI